MGMIVFSILLMVAGVVTMRAAMPLGTSGKKQAFLAGLTIMALGVVFLALTLLVSHPGWFWFIVAVGIFVSIWFPVQKSRAVAAAKVAVASAKSAADDLRKDYR